jgi:U3 small nucleolar ribonucleoprotein protein IMP4
MLRRNARQRREYLYKRAASLQEAQLHAKRSALKTALDEGRKLNPDLAKDRAVQEQYVFDEAKAAEATEIEDEFSVLSGVSDPRIVISTSRDCSSRLLQFAKEIKLLLPTSIRLNRGNMVLPTLAHAAQAASITDVVMLHEHRGVPTSLTLSHFPHGPTAFFSLHNVVLRHDINDPGTVSEVFPQLIFEGFTTPLGVRVKRVLQHLFPPGPKRDSPRVVSFVNQDGFISVRHHVYVRLQNGTVELAEAGPRFEMKLYELRLGTLENKDADVEWRLHSFMRTSHKRDLL